jgi:hypothetical protein
MHKSTSPLLALLFAFASLIGISARSAELEGALQYPPPSIGEDAQPPPPAMMVPPAVSPRRIELGGSGSSVPSGTHQFFKPPPIRWEGSGAPIPSNAGAG